MSYLKLEHGLPDFSKAVISLWFRIPAASIEAIRDQPAAPNSNEWIRNVIPLMTFGRKQSAVSWNHELVDVMNWMSPPLGLNPTFFQNIYDATSTFEGYVPPCIIGVDCSGTPRLTVRLQMEVIPNIVGYNLFSPAVFGYNIGDPDGLAAAMAAGFQPLGNPPGNGWTEQTGYATFCPEAVDYSYSMAEVPANLNVTVMDKEIVPDKWHHLLASFDLSPGVATHGNPYPGVPYPTIDEGTDDACKAWLAIDDTNYSGANNLGPNFVEGGDDNNAIITAEAAIIALSNNSRLFLNLFTDGSNYQSGDLSVPSGDAMFGVPAPPYYLGNIVRVEMAELQIFTGVALDTGVESKRRAFITSEGRPELDYSIAEDLLGKKPAIRLHKSGNWISGKNTGTLGIDNVGNIIAAGQFARFAAIKRWKPDPSLHGPQNPGETTP